MNLLKRLLLLPAFFVLLLIFTAHTTANAASFLYAINDNPAGNQIYGFSVNETTGALTALPGFPVSTGFNGANSTNLEMITIDSLNKRLYAINRGSNNISAYSIDPTTGALTPLPFSPIAGIPNERTIKVHPSGSPLIVGGDAIASYVITATSATPAAGSPYPLSTVVSPGGSTLSNDGNYYYAGGNTGNFFAGFAVNASTGVLTPLEGSPYDTGGATPYPTATDATGRLYVVPSRLATTRVYTTSNGIPTFATANPNGLTGITAQGEVHPNGNFFVLADRSNSRIGVYQIMGSGAMTTLTAVPGSPFATGAALSLTFTFNQNGNFLYTANSSTSRNITTFGFNTSTGALTNLGTLPTNTLGTSGIINGIAYVNFSAANVPNDAPLDFNGDGKSDYVVTRSADANSQSTWLINLNGSGAGLSQAVPFGIGVGLGTATSDRAVPEDFDGDGKDDIAVWRPTGLGDPGKAYFFILQSSDNTLRSEPFGKQGDDPSIVRDYDGDGKSDLAVFRRGSAITAGDPCGGSAVWYYRPSASTGVNFQYVCWGAPSDFPSPGDYDGDGKGDFVVQRSNGAGVSATFYLNQSTAGFEAVNWGLPTDIIVPGDYDGDGKTDIAVSRSVSGIRNWFILERDGGTQTYQFGSSTDAPAMGDYDGDGKTDIAVWRTNANPAQVFFFVRPSGTSGANDFQIPWGQQNDYPVARYNVH